MQPADFIHGFLRKNPSTSRPHFMPICFTPLCFNAPYQYMLLYPAWSRWRTYHECCSRRDTARSSVKMGNWAGRTHSQKPPRQVYWSLLGINSEWCWYKWTVLSSTLGILDPFINISTGSPASFKAAGHRSRYFYRLKLHKAATVTCVNPYIAYSSQAWSAYWEMKVYINSNTYRKARTQHNEISLWLTYSTYHNPKERKK